MELTLFLKTPESTYLLGELIGKKLDNGNVLALIGDLGAGKTSLTQGIAKGLGVPGDIPVVSPTFTLANEYPGRIRLNHLDVYRLSGDEFLDAGLDDYFSGNGVTVVEWADRIEDELPEDRLEIELTVIPSDGREVRIRSIGTGFGTLVEEIKKGAPL